MLHDLFKLVTYLIKILLLIMNEWFIVEINFIKRNIQIFMYYSQKKLRIFFIFGSWWTIKKCKKHHQNCFF